MKFRIFILLTPLLCFSVQTGATPGFMPDWKVGDSWRIAAVYPSPTDPGIWSDPIFWQYKVMERAVENGEPVYEIAVSSADGGSQFSARFRYRLSDLSLAGVELSRIRRGREVKKRMNFQPLRPVSTTEGLIPFDTPVFPISAPSSSEYTVKEKLAGGLSYIRHFQQTVRQVQGVEETQLKGPFIEVQCIEADGDLVFRQYWKKSLPWPVFGQNRYMKYQLIEK